ncbi:MAG: [Fe-Fe] hydrogenase large subunit C-terminal domain-containing protein, partial [Clostridia bacterium]
LKKPGLPRPMISAACPAIVRLIQVRFPELIDHVINLRQPIEAAAMVAKREFSQNCRVPEEEIGCFFITPCPAKMTAIRSPIGHEKSAMDGAISILEIYGLLSSHARKPMEKKEKLQNATPWGVGWANTGGEALAIGHENSLAVDGIENVIHVLEEIENNKLNDLEFFEGLACTGGCVGGPLVFENSYVAKNAIRKLTENLPPQRLEDAVDISMLTQYPIYNTQPILPNSVMKLDDNLAEAMRKMERLEQLAEDLPGFDCGSCGSPTCRTLAEDIVRGYAGEMECIHKLKERLRVMAEQMVELSSASKRKEYP